MSESIFVLSHLTPTVKHIQKLAPCDFGVPVRYMGAFPLGVPQRTDHVAQRQKSAVDLNALLEPLTRIASLEDALGSGQVHEMKLGGEDERVSAAPPLLHGDGEDGVRATGVRVHLGGSCVSGRVSRF